MGKLSFFPSAPHFSSSFTLRLSLSSYHFAVRFPSSSFSRLFLSTALNLLSVLSNKVYGSAGELIYIEKKEETGERRSYVRSLAPLCGRNNCGILRLWIATVPCIEPNSWSSRILWTTALRDIGRDIAFTLVSSLRIFVNLRWHDYHRLAQNYFAALPRENSHIYPA